MVIRKRKHKTEMKNEIGLYLSVPPKKRHDLQQLLHARLFVYIVLYCYIVSSKRETINMTVLMCCYYYTQNILNLPPLDTY